MFSYGVSYKPAGDVLLEREAVYGPLYGSLVSRGGNGYIPASPGWKTSLSAGNSVVPIPDKPAFDGEDGRRPATDSEISASTEKEEQDDAGEEDAIVDGNAGKDVLPSREEEEFFFSAGGLQPVLPAAGAHDNPLDVNTDIVLDRPWVSYGNDSIDVKSHQTLTIRNDVVRMGPDDGIYLNDFSILVIEQQATPSAGDDSNVLTLYAGASSTDKRKTTVIKRGEGDTVLEFGNQVDGWNYAGEMLVKDGSLTLQNARVKLSCCNDADNSGTLVLSNSTAFFYVFEENDAHVFNIALKFADGTKNVLNVESLEVTMNKSISGNGTVTTLGEAGGRLVFTARNDDFHGNFLVEKGTVVLKENGNLGSADVTIGRYNNVALVVNVYEGQQVHFSKITNGDVLNVVSGKVALGSYSSFYEQDGSLSQKGIVRVSGGILDAATAGQSSSSLDHSTVQLYKGTIENFKRSPQAASQGDDVHFYVGMPLFGGAGTMVVKNSEFVANEKGLYHGIASAGSHAELYNSTVRLENYGNVIWGNDTNALFTLDRDSRLSIAFSLMVVNCLAVAEDKTFSKGDETWFRLDLVSGGKGGAGGDPLLEMMDPEGKLDSSRFAVYMPGWMTEAGVTSEDFLNGYHYDDGSGDAWFEFLIPPPVVPEPSLAMLAACGLMGLLLGRRR